MYKLKERKGFTLAELLIVVAIIAVLVAVAIPVFTTQLEKSRDATSVANIRSAYAEAMTDYLTGEAGSSNTITKSAVIQTTTANSWSGNGANLPFKAPKDNGGVKKATSTKITFTFADDGSVTASW
ncbi:type II secretion system protein [Butyrivibrio sp. FCS006]|uniref:type II secretion system protein n=1 Tax=Butyrivibrio sp. FCS006 TaxID=1280684 RepID=UPI0004158296|nr:type II secretion system protein [Butyrivibrio sp. FCS006]